MTQGGERWPTGPTIDPYGSRPPQADPRIDFSGAGRFDDEADADPGDILFGLDPVDGGASASQEPAADHARRRARARRSRVAAAVVAVLAAIAVTLAVVRLSTGGTDDWSGSGFGTVSVAVASGDTAADIGDALQKAGVVKTSQAFVDAAKADPKSTGIQPGTYVLHRHMSGQAALDLLLDPSSRDKNSDTVVTEGATTLDVRERLEQVFGASAANEIDHVFSHPQELTLPSNYAPAGGGKLTSLEGFLFPATYTFDPHSKPADAIQQMVSKFTYVDRQMNFAAQAKQHHLTPYEALIIASIAQSEARFASDMPKVARTILNRLSKGRPLQLDSTASYACKLRGIKNCIYASVSSPYNTYRNTGLPPTPIDNPGQAALEAAVHPAPGNYLYFVTKDAAGHLFFTNDQQEFANAAAKCHAQHWGCG